MAVTGKVFDIFLLKRVLWFAMPYKRTLYLGLFLTILLAFLAPLRPWLIQYAFDNYILTSIPLLMNSNLIIFKRAIKSAFQDMRTQVATPQRFCAGAHKRDEHPADI